MMIQNKQTPSLNVFCDFMLNDEIIFPRLIVDITVEIIYFYFQIMPNFYPTLAERVTRGIKTALKVILDKRVLQ